jgi:MFS family permease
MLISIGAAPAFAWVVGSSFLLGLAMPSIMAGLTTITQLAVPDLKRGRVSGLMGAVATVASILSMAAAGIAGEHTDLRWIYGAAGVIVASAGLVSLLAVEEPTAMAREEVLT